MLIFRGVYHWGKKWSWGISILNSFGFGICFFFIWIWFQKMPKWKTNDIEVKKPYYKWPDFLSEMLAGLEAYWYPKCSSKGGSQCSSLPGSRCPCNNNFHGHWVLQKRSNTQAGRWVPKFHPRIYFKDSYTACEGFLYSLWRMWSPDFRKEKVMSSVDHKEISEISSDSLILPRILDVWGHAVFLLAVL